MKHIAISENHLYSKSYAKGNKYVGKNVVIYVLKDLKAKKLMMANPMKVYINRIGITVSKKLGGAVCRTRIKRILREGLRQTEKENKVKQNRMCAFLKNLHESTEKGNERIPVDQQSLLSSKG